MRLNTVRESCSLGQRFVLYPLGDIHLGSANCDKKRLARTIESIKSNPNARWLGMGDIVESIAPDDKRWAPDDVDADMTLLRQKEIADYYKDKIAELFAPIIDKCWGVCDGNHEDRFNSRYFTNLHKRVLQKLGREDLYGEWSCVTRVVFEDASNHRSALRVYQQHGWQAGRKKGAKVNNLDDLMGYIEGCHIYLVAHSHERIITTKTKLGTNPSFTDLKAYDAYGAHTGSYLRTYQLGKVGYAEKKSFPPTSLGGVWFNVTPTAKGVEIEGVQ